MMLNSRIRSGGLSATAKPLRVGIFVLLATAIAFAPVLVYGFPADSWDIRFHALWTRNFSDQLWAGELYPRWLFQINDGLGSPYFFYYSPLAYYLASLFQAFRTPTGIAQISLASITLLFLSGLACYRWLLGICGRTGALVGTCFYVIAPSHVFVDAYVRGDYPEFASYVWLPAILHGVELVRSRRAIGFVQITLSYAGLVLTHVVTGLVFSGVPFLYALGRFEQRSRALLVLLANVMGLALASVYLLPALTTQSDVSMPWRHLTLVFDVWTPKLVLFINLLFVAYAMAVVGTGIVLWHLSSRKLGSFEYTLLLICAATMVSMTGLARPIWDLVPMSRAVQFAWRLNSVIDIGLAGLTAAVTAELSRRVGERRLLTAAVAAFSAMAVMADVCAVRFGVFDFDPMLWSKRVAYSPDYGLFRPLTARNPLPADKLPLWGGGAGLDAEVVPIAKIVSADSAARVQVTRWRPRDIAFSIDATVPGTAVVAQLYYPGWQAVSATTGRALPTRPSDDRGLVAIDYGAGIDEVRLHLVRRPAERLGWFSTGVTAVVFVLVIIVLQRRWSRHARVAGALAQRMSG
jgi:hypothetical protein